jgi:hypothetical protein
MWKERMCKRGKREWSVGREMLGRDKGVGEVEMWEEEWTVDCG